MKPQPQVVNDSFERAGSIIKFRNLRDVNKAVAHPSAFISVHFDLAHIASIENFNCFQIHCGRVKLVWN